MDVGIPEWEKIFACNILSIAHIQQDKDGSWHQDARGHDVLDYAFIAEDWEALELQNILGHEVSRERMKRWFESALEEEAGGAEKIILPDEKGAVLINSGSR